MHIQKKNTDTLTVLKYTCFCVYHQGIYFSQITICLPQTPSRVCYTDHTCVSDALNNSQQLHKKCKPRRSVLIKGVKRMWSNTPLIAADDKNVAILHRWDFPQGDFVITGCVSWLAEAEVISIPSGVEMLAVAAAAAADDSAEQWHRADEADESCARRPEEGGEGWGAEGQADLQHQQTGGSQRFI